MSLAAGIAESTVRLATPLLLAAMGEVIAERSGVLNLGVEGMMVAGALTGFVVTFLTGSAWIGLFAGMLAGATLAFLHAVLCVTLKADQVISGIMITLLGVGITTYFSSDANRLVGGSIDGFSTTTIPFVSEIPIIGQALFSITTIDYIALLLVPFVWFFLFRTNIGAEITAVGEDPEAADTAGVPIFRIQYACVLLGGLLAGAGGAHLTLAANNFWATEITAGRGWIAVALVIFAQWSIWKLVFGAWLFGAVDALSIRASGSLGEDLLGEGFLASVLDFFSNSQVMETYPFIVTILVLWWVMRQGNLNELGAPRALLQPYSRERD